MINSSPASELDSLNYVVKTDTSLLEQARAHIGISYLYSDTAPDIALSHGMLAHDICGELKNDSLTHRALQAMGYAFYIMGDYENLLKYSLEALELADNMGDAHMICNDHAWISSALLELGYTQRSIDHSKKALQMAVASRDSSLIAYSTLDMEAGYLVLEDYAKGIEYCQQALELFEQLNDTIGQAFAIQQIGRSYVRQEKYSDALPFSAKAFKIMAEHRAGSIAVMWSLQDLAEIYTGLGDLENAELSIAQAEQIATDLNARHDLAGVLETRSRLAEKKGDLVSALKYYKAYKELNDTLFNANIARQMAGLQTIYEADKRDQENELLRNQNDLQQATITNQKLTNTLLISGVALLIVLCLSFFLQFRSKKKVNQKLRDRNQVIKEQSEEIGKKNLELQRQNVRLAESMVSDDEKKLLLKEIHHRVKNNLQIINSLLKMQSLHITDKVSLKMFEESQGRIVSMALVHEQLYNSVDLSNVVIDEYINKLVQRSIGIYGMGIDVHLDLSCTVKGFPIDTLIPLGLLLNEMLTNTLKYAFGNRGFGTIRIELDEVGDNVFRLIFADDGIGISEKVFEQGGTFGVDLIHTLVGQLDGEVVLNSSTGTSFTVTFRQDQKLLKAAS